MAAGSQYTCTTGKITLSASATKSLVLLAPASTTSFRVTGISVSLDASAAAAGVEMDLYRVNSLGSPAGTTATFNPTFEETTPASPNTTGLTALSTEPTSVYILDSWYVQPFGGLLVVQFPLGREHGAKASGSRIGLRYTTPASVTPDCLCTIYFEE